MVGRSCDARVPSAGGSTLRNSESNHNFSRNLNRILEIFLENFTGIGGEESLGADGTEVSCRVTLTLVVCV